MDTNAESECGKIRDSNALLGVLSTEDTEGFRSIFQIFCFMFHIFTETGAARPMF